MLSQIIPNKHTFVPAIIPDSPFLPTNNKWIFLSNNEEYQQKYDKDLPKNMVK